MIHQQNPEVFPNIEVIKVSVKKRPLGPSQYGDNTYFGIRHCYALLELKNGVIYIIERGIQPQFYCKVYVPSNLSIHSILEEKVQGTSLQKLIKLCNQKFCKQYRVYFNDCYVFVRLVVECLGCSPLTINQINVFSTKSIKEQIKQGALVKDQKGYQNTPAQFLQYVNDDNKKFSGSVYGLQFFQKDGNFFIKYITSVLWYKIRFYGCIEVLSVSQKQYKNSKTIQTIVRRLHKHQNQFYVNQNQVSIRIYMFIYYNYKQMLTQYKCQISPFNGNDMDEIIKEAHRKLQKMIQI